jgi:DNA-binding NtrC family response regulator
MPDGLQGKRILVVEDERVIAETLMKILSAAGYDARASHSAEDALAMLEEAAWSPDFSIIDVSLPGMNGIELAIRFKTEQPNWRLTLFSGQSSTSELLEKAQQDGQHFDVLAKPVHPSELLALICHALSPLSATTTDESS